MKDESAAKDIVAKKSELNREREKKIQEDVESKKDSSNENAESNSAQVKKDEKGEIFDQPEESSKISYKNPEMKVEQKLDSRVSSQQQMEMLVSTDFKKPVKQFYCSVGEPVSVTSTIRKGTTVSLHYVVVLAIIATFPSVLNFLRNVTKEKKKDEENERTSFFVNTYSLYHYFELDGWVIATPNCFILNENRKEGEKIEPFMLGQVVAILDEITHQVSVEVFPNKCFIYKTSKNFLTPFVNINEVINIGEIKGPTPPSSILNFKIPYQQSIKNYYGKIKDQLFSSN